MKKLITMLVAIIATTFVGFASEGESTPTYYIAGNGTETNNWCCGLNWNEKGCGMADNSYAAKVPAGKYKFKITNGTWDTTWGYDAVDATKSTSGYSGNGDGNVNFEVLEEANISVSFNGTKITLTSDVEFYVPEVEPITVKLKASTVSDWGAVAIHYWGDESSTWPGDKLTAEDGWYSKSFKPTTTSINIIWNNNNGGKQTVNIEGVTASTCYEISGGSGTSYTVKSVDCTSQPTPAEPASSIDVAIKLPSTWDEPAIYSWGGEHSGAAKMTKGDDAGELTWWTGVAYSDFSGFLFKNKADAETWTLQTADVTVPTEKTCYELGSLEDGKYKTAITDCPTPPTPEEPTVTAINIAGSKLVGEELTFTATVAKFSGEPTITYAVKQGEGEYQAAEGGKFTPDAADSYTVKATATYESAGGEKEEAVLELPFTVTTAPESIVVKLLESSTTWSEVAIYAFDNAGTITKAWPGDKLTAADGWYSYTIEGEHEGLQIIFNNNVAEGASQTVDTPVSESTCYELGDTDESGKFALNVRECTVPETGYGIKIDGETIVMGEKNPKAENEWMILNQSLAKGQTFALYDASTGGTWAVALDEASVPGITKEENSYSVTADGCYSFYLKLSYGADQLYVGKGECGPTQETWIIAGDAALMGSEWDPADENNKMTINGDMISYSLVKEGVSLTAGNYEYKAVEGMSWIGTQQVPQEGNNTLTIEATGTYLVEFYLVPGTNTLTAKASIATEDETPNEEETPSTYKVFENNEIILVTPNGRCNLIGVPR
ncbi:MAG: starch-binding protein [Paludibacteraceae bacterium]|nr:starch-binding protein [Paludibacteraceae bacterium]